MSAPMQTSIYDVERQPLMDLERPLIKALPVPAFNFDLAEVKASVESGVVEFPSGLTGAERKRWLRDRLTALPAPVIQSQHLRWTTEHFAEVSLALVGHVAAPSIGMSRRTY